VTRRASLNIDGVGAASSLKVDYSFDQSGEPRISLRSEGRTHASIALPLVNSEENDPFKAWWGSFLIDSRPMISEAHSEHQPLRILDLFSSAGGLSLGFLTAMRLFGLGVAEHIGVDQDGEALAVFRRRFSGSGFTIQGSVSDLVDGPISGRGRDASFNYAPEILNPQLQELGGVDVVLAGPPCQGHSSLNNHTRGSDEKNRLYLKVPALAIALGARFVVIENVPNVIRDSESVVATTVALLRTAGYRTTQGVLAADRFGWPQTRKRYFVLAVRDDEPLPIDKVLKSAWGREASGVGWLLDLAAFGSDMSDPLTLPTAHSEANQRRIDYLFDEDVDGLPNSQRPECHQNGTSYSASYGRMSLERPAPTITTGFTSPGRGRFIHPRERRTVNPREAALIQGFPLDYPFVDSRAVPSRTAVATWIGNAVPTILGMAAGTAVLAPVFAGIKDQDLRLALDVV
jgi:DNA (cytosine-5)-methyltransferase 1